MTSEREEREREQLGLSKKQRKPPEPSGMEVHIRQEMRRPAPIERPIYQGPTADDLARQQQMADDRFREIQRKKGRSEVEIERDVALFHQTNPVNLEPEVRRQMGFHQKPSEPSELEERIRKRGRLV